MLDASRLSRMKALVSGLHFLFLLFRQSQSFVNINSAVETLTVAVIKVILKNKDSAEVFCSIDKQSNILNGFVNEAIIRGRNWRSPRDLTCRFIEVRIESAQIDMDELRNRRLRLAGTSYGSALLELSALDFQNLLVHPQVTAVPVDEKRILSFLPRGCSIDAKNRIITLNGCLDDEARVIQLKQLENGNRLAARILPSTFDGCGSHDSEVKKEKDLVDSSRVARFFQEFSMDLDGVLFQYENLEFRRRANDDDIVRLILRVSVKRIPTIGKTEF